MMEKNKKKKKKEDSTKGQNMKEEEEDEEEEGEKEEYVHSFGTEGFEPSNNRTKTHCLSTWPCPCNIFHLNILYFIIYRYSFYFLLCMGK